MLPPEMDIFRGADVMYVAAEIYALIGEDQKALDLMARHQSMPSVYRATWWTHPPAFQRLRDTHNETRTLSKDAFQLKP